MFELRQGHLPSTVSMRTSRDGAQHSTFLIDLRN
jgi:hypothetical protein